MEMSQENAYLVGQVMQAMNQSEKQEKIERFKRLNAYVKPDQIVFAGSSLMEQFPIYEFLQDFDLPFTIYNRGVGGFTTAEFHAAIQHCVYDLKPRAVFLNIGTNDMNGADYTQDALLAQYEDIIKDILKNVPGVNLTLMAFYPVNPTADGPAYLEYVFQYRTNQAIATANRAVQELAQRYHLGFLDLNAGITDENGCLKLEYTIEGMHMYANGYKAVLDALLPVLYKV